MVEVVEQINCQGREVRLRGAQLIDEIFDLRKSEDATLTPKSVRNLKVVEYASYQFQLAISARENSVMRPPGFG